MIIQCDDSAVQTIATLEQTLFEHFWTEEQIRGHLASGNPIWLDVDEHDTVRGVLVVAKLWGEWEIYRIGVIPRYRGSGIAKGLLNHLESVASPGETLFLEVRCDNRAARNLYESMGFQETGVRRNYYADGEDALCMMKSL